MPIDPIKRAMKLATEPAKPAVNVFDRAQQGEIIDRESLLAATLDVYAGKTAKYFQPLPGEAYRSAKTGEGMERPGRIDLNNLRQWADILSNTYGGEPQRTYARDGEIIQADADPVIEAVTERYNQCEVNRVMEDADCLLNLVGNVVARPYLDEDNDELTIQLYRTPAVRVVDNPINARRPLATVLMGTERDDNDTEIRVAEIWTANQMVMVHNGQPKAAAAIPFNPLVHMFNRLPTNLTRYYVPCFGPALAHLDRLLNNDMIGPLGFTAIMQGFGQMVIWGADDATQFTAGPGRAFKFSGDPDRRQDMEFKAPNAPIMDVLEVVREVIRMIERAHGIPNGLLDVKTDASGAAIVQANAPLAEMREKRGKVFKRPEIDLLRSTIQVLAGRDDRVPISVDPMQYNVSVRYTDPSVNMSVADKNAREQFLIDIGVMTAGDIAVHEFPGRWKDAQEADAEIGARTEAKQAEEREHEIEKAKAMGTAKPPGVGFGKPPEN